MRKGGRAPRSPPGREERVSLRNGNNRPAGSRTENAKDWGKIGGRRKWGGGGESTSGQRGASPGARASRDIPECDRTQASTSHGTEPSFLRGGAPQSARHTQTQRRPVWGARGPLTLRTNYFDLAFPGRTRQRRRLRRAWRRTALPRGRPRRAGPSRRPAALPARALSGPADPAPGGRRSLLPGATARQPRPGPATSVLALTWRLPWVSRLSLPRRLEKPVKKKTLRLVKSHWPIKPSFLPQRGGDRLPGLWPRRREGSGGGVQ